MLMSSLTGQTQSVLVQILTYAQLERKMNLNTGRRNQNNNKKYIIMTYMSQFDKAHYPLSLNYFQNPSVDRMRITIRRLSQELTTNSYGNGSTLGVSTNGDMKQISILRYENETLRARVKSLEQKLNKDGQNLMQRSNISMKSHPIEILKQQQSQNMSKIIELNKTLQFKTKQLQQVNKKLKIYEQQKLKQQTILLQLRQQITNLKQQRIKLRQQSQTVALFEDKLNQMNQQMSELLGQLQHAREKEKKNNLKIVNLEKQLEKLMNQKEKRKTYGTGLNSTSNRLASSRKSENQKSVKSYTSKKSNQSRTSQQSQNKTKNLSSYLRGKPLDNSASKKKIPTKRPSVYDSDTESSKMRKNNNLRVSPYRQNSKPTNNLSTSSKKPVRKTLTSTMNNRFEGNILKNSRNSNRSRSRSVKKQNSPTAENIDFPTDNFQSSSEDERNINEALTKLKERKNRVKRVNSREKPKEQGGMGPLQKKITNIAEMLRKAKSRDNKE